MNAHNLRRALAPTIAPVGGTPRDDARRPARIATLLIALVFAVLVPTLAVGIFATYEAVTGERAQAEASLRDTAHALALAVDLKVSRLVTAAQTFAAYPLGGQNAHLSLTQELDIHARMVARQLGVSISIVRRDGSRLMSTRVPPGTPVPPAHAIKLIETVFDTGRPAVNNLVRGSVSQQLTIAAAAPIHDANGEVVLVAILSFEADQLRQLLVKEALPAGTISAIVDGNGILVARSDDLSATLVGTPIQEAYWARIQDGDTGLYRLAARDGKLRDFVYFKVPSTPGWAVVVGQPNDVLDSAWRYPLMLFICGTVVVLALATVLALTLANQILRPLRQLTAHARAIALAGGESLANQRMAGVVPPCEVAELETLRQGFDAAEQALRKYALSERSVSADLAAREAELRAIFEASPVGLARCTAGGHILDANDVVLRMIGATRQELALGGLWLEDLTAPEFRRLSTSAIAQAQDAADGRSPPFEQELMHRDGSRVPVLASMAVIDWRKQEIAVFILDLTDIRRLDARLAESEARHRALLGTVLEGIIVASEDGRITSVNPSAVRMFGYDSETEMVGLPLAALMPASEAALHDNYLEAHRGSGNARVIGVPGRELIARRHDGTEFPIDLSVSSFRFGSARFFTGVLRDATERKRAEAALRDSEARFRALATATREGIVFHHRGVVVDCNDGFADLLGYDREEIVGSPGSDFVAPEAIEDMDSRMRARDETPYETVLLRKDGARLPVEAEGRLLQYQGRTVRVAAVRDLTQRKAAEVVLARDKAELERLVELRTSELRESEARLAQAAKMEALGRLAGGVAHDFNNVLQAVRGGIDLAMRRMQADPVRSRAYLQLASDATDRGAAVTGRLLAFARRTDLSAVAIAPGPLLEGLGALLRHTLGPEVTLTIEVDRVPALLADLGQLETVLVNLVNNARDALHNGHGTVRLVASHRMAPAPDAPLLPPGAYVRLAVIDNGAGMPPDVLARVTEPFFTTKPKGQGTGLGLAMARGFAEQSGGALTIESVAHEGTTVTLWLPVAEADAPSIDDAADPAGSTGTRKTLSVLLVDDEATLRRMLAVSLADEGHEVTEAGDAATALDLMAQGLTVDVLVTDLSMPGSIDGLALIRDVRRCRPGLPAILITGHVGEAEHAALEAVRASGPFSLMHKPFPNGILAAQVAALVR